LSDWDIGRFSVDDWVDDLAAVVDAVGLDRFSLLGISRGGAVAIAYAVRHPERVSRLVRSRVAALPAEIDRFLPGG